MLTGQEIVIMGGDARQLEMIEKLLEKDATVYLIGFDQLEHDFKGAQQTTVEELPFDRLQAMVLPVSGVNEKGEVETLFSREPVQLTSALLKKTPSHFTIYTGISNDYLNRVTAEADRRLVRLFERDDVAIYNSIPTVEGTIMMVIQHTDFTIHGSTVSVLGFGRVGQSVARTFHALGANVKVGANKTEEMARITEMGLQPFAIERLKEAVSDVDICINTIPAPILRADVLAEMVEHVLIVDLASKPGGTDFRYAEKRGIEALLAPGLPGIVAPKTAGRIIANVLVTLLEDDKTSMKGE